MTTEDFDALLAEIAELKARLARCVELPDMDEWTAIEVSGCGKDQGFTASYCRVCVPEKPVRDDGTNERYDDIKRIRHHLSVKQRQKTPTAALAALKESINANHA